MRGARRHERWRSLAKYTALVVGFGFVFGMLHAPVDLIGAIACFALWEALQEPPRAV